MRVTVYRCVNGGARSLNLPRADKSPSERRSGGPRHGVCSRQPAWPGRVRSPRAISAAGLSRRCSTGRSPPTCRRSWRGRPGRTTAVGFIVATLTGTNRAVVRFYNQRGTAEQWIKEGKTATHWTRLSCHHFRANEVRLLLGVIAYNLGNLLRRLVLPIAIQDWSLTSLQPRLFKTGGRLIRHARYFILQLAESHLTPNLFRQILGRIERLAY